MIMDKILGVRGCGKTANLMRLCVEKGYVYLVEDDYYKKIMKEKARLYGIEGLNIDTYENLGKISQPIVVDELDIAINRLFAREYGCQLAAYTLTID